MIIIYNFYLRDLLMVLIRICSLREEIYLLIILKYINKNII